MIEKDWRKILTASCAIIFLPLSPVRIDNYIDPGTGSIIIQVVIATLAGGIYMAKTYWIRIKAFFSRSPDSAKKNDRSED